MVKRMGLTVLAAYMILFIHTEIPSAVAEAAKNNVSQFEPEISALVYPPVNYTDQALDLSWDFSTDEVFSFQFDQTVYMTSDMGRKPEGSDPDGSVSTSSGEILVKSLGNGLARVVFQNMESTMEIQTSEGPQTMSQKLPVKVVGEINETGRGAESAKQRNLPTDDMFPLPGKPIRLGESVVYPVNLPFNAMGSLLYVRGEEKITLTGFVLRDSRLCAQLDVAQEVKDLTVPPEIEGDYYFSKIQTARAFFDIERKRFVEVIIAARMVMGVKSPSPDVSFSDDKEFKENIPKEMRMSMDTDNLIRVVAK